MTVSVKAAEAIARLASLLSHPLRVRLMAALATEGPGSATSFSDHFGDVSVGDCHYHLTALRNGGVIELVRSRQVRGATERIYRLRPRSRWRGAQYFRPFIDVLLPPNYGRSATPAGD